MKPPTIIAIRSSSTIFETEFAHVTIKQRTVKIKLNENLELIMDGPQKSIPKAMSGKRL